MLGGNEQRAQGRCGHEAGEKTGNQGLDTLQSTHLRFLRLPPSGDFLMGTPLLLSVKRVRSWGGSYVVTLDRDVRRALGMGEGETIAFHKVGSHVFLSVVRDFAAIEISQEELRQAREASGM